MKQKMRWGLFPQIAAVLTVSLLLTNAFVAGISIRIAEKYFIRTSTALNQTLLEQAAQDLDKFHNQNISIVNTYRQNYSLEAYFTRQFADEKELARVIYEIDHYFTSLIRTHASLFHTISVGKNNALFVSTSERLLMTPQQIVDTLPPTGNALPQSRLTYCYSPTGFTQSTWQQDVIVAVKALANPYTGESFGTVFMTTTEADFFGMLSPAPLGEGIHLLALSPGGQIIAADQKDKVGQYDRDLLQKATAYTQHQLEFMTTKVDGTDALLFARHIPGLDLLLVSTVDKKTMMRDFGALQQLVALVCIVTISVTVSIVFAIAKRITSPISHLSGKMSAFAGGRFARIDHIQGSIEVRELQQVYNNMAGELDRYVNRLLQEQEQRRKAEIAALQMQINPHFLYNTLASIKYLSWQGNSQAVTEMIHSLILLLKNTVGKGDEVIPLKQELEMLKSYVKISRMRFGEKINVFFHLQPHTECCQLPKLILQPFVENAFFHGFQRKKQGSIHIFSYTKGNTLVCEIIDDGDGMPTASHQWQSQQKKQQFSGIGIQNVEERLQLIYRGQGGVEIVSVPDVGTTVTITIPQSEKLPIAQETTNPQNSQ